MNERNPVESLADIRHEFGEHGGVNMSVEASTTFTVMDPSTIPEIFEGGKGPDQGVGVVGERDVLVQRRPFSLPRVPHGFGHQGGYRPGARVHRDQPPHRLPV